MKKIGAVQYGSLRQTLPGLCLVIALAWPSAVAWAANDGHIVSLTLTGASSPGGCIDVNAQVQADSDVNNSNLYFELFAPNGSRIGTSEASLAGMTAGQTASSGMSYCNPPSTGTYSVTLCWSTGNGNHNCNIDGADTDGSSVPTLGWVLGTAAAGLLGLFLYRRRNEFAWDRR